MHLGGLYNFQLDYNTSQEIENETPSKNTFYNDKIQEQVDMDIQVYGEQEKKVTIDDGKGNVTTIKVENIPKNTT